MPDVTIHLPAGGGEASIVIDGHDLTRLVEAVTMTAEAGDTASVALHLRRGLDVAVTAAAAVHIDPGLIGDDVRSLDPNDVRARVDQRRLTMADDPYAAILDVVAELLDEGDDRSKLDEIVAISQDLGLYEPMDD